MLYVSDTKFALLHWMLLYNCAWYKLMSVYYISNDSSVLTRYISQFFMTDKSLILALNVLSEKKYQAVME